MQGLREQQKQRRRDRIAEATLMLLEQEGQDGLAVTAIASRAGLSVTSLYNLIGRLGDILDYLVAGFSKSLLLAMAPHKDLQTDDFFRTFVESGNALLLGRERAWRCALAVWFRQGLGGAATSRRREIDRAMIVLMWRAVEQGRSAGLLIGESNPRLLAEESGQAHMRLLESWASGVIELPELEQRSLFHIFSLLKAWASPAFSIVLQRQLLELQSALESSRDRSGQSAVADIAITG